MVIFTGVVVGRVVAAGLASCLLVSRELGMKCVSRFVGSSLLGKALRD